MEPANMNPLELPSQDQQSSIPSRLQIDKLLGSSGDKDFSAFTRKSPSPLYNFKQQREKENL